MKKDYTHITYVIDKSGSMNPLVADVIGGFNKFLEDQKREPGKATLSLIMFSTVVSSRCCMTDINKVEPLTTSTYEPGGGTALLDAVSEAIERTGQDLRTLPEDKRPEKVMVLIMTDGEENSSKFITRDALASKIRHQERKYSWNFVFVGANQDSFAEARSLGIRPDMVMNYVSDSKGTQDAYTSMSEGMLRARRSKGARVQDYFSKK